MSAPRISPKRWLITADGALINSDYVVRVYQDNGAPTVDLENGEHHELSLEQSLDDFFADKQNAVFAGITNL